MRGKFRVSQATVDRRFWSKVDKGAECWLWRASTFRTGRGQFRIGGLNRPAHRVAWELTIGSSPQGILRSGCGNLLCVRPEHQVVAEKRVGPTNLARTADRRFEDMVLAGPDCWQWTGSITRLGYGQFSATTAGGRRMRPAHRVAWEQAFGAIPPAADVLHSCGNRACVRPDHLLLLVPSDAAHRPTARQLEILRAWVDLGMGRGSPKRIAAQLRLSTGTVYSQMWRMRKRLQVASTQEAVDWLHRQMSDPRSRPMARQLDQIAMDDGTAHYGNRIRPASASLRKAKCAPVSGARPHRKE